MIKYLLLLVVGVVGCGADDPETTVYRRTPSKPDVEVSLQSVVDEFYSLCKEQGNQKCLDNWKRIRSIEVVTEEVLNPSEADKDSPKAGVCYMWVAGEKLHSAKIEIHERYLNDPVVLRGLVYHELGHCALGLEHTEASWVDLHMMNPYLYDEYIYSNYWEQLVEDQFESSLGLVDGTEHSSDVVTSNI